MIEQAVKCSGACYGDVLIASVERYSCIICGNIGCFYIVMRLQMAMPATILAFNMWQARLLSHEIVCIEKDTEQRHMSYP